MLSFQNTNFALLEDFIISSHHRRLLFLPRGHAPSLTYMVMEGAGGWPLGLGNMNIRVGVPESYSIETPSSSFSSLTSSNLDTQSSASFFQDNSVSLGQLIGYRPGNRRMLQRSLSSQRVVGNGGNSTGGNRRKCTCQGLCAPLIQNVMEKMVRSKCISRH